MKETRTLTRDVEAVMIPDGQAVRLAAGETAVLHQTLGGTYTVVVQGNMFRIDGRDADALGMDIAPKEGSTETGGIVDEKRVLDALRQCYDPEIPINIVDLGLVYDCDISGSAEEGYRVHVKMTLTAPGCGMGPVIARDAESRLKEIAGVTEAHIDVVWDPPWSQEMMTDAAKLQLGLF